MTSESHCITVNAIDIAGGERYIVGPRICARLQIDLNSQKALSQRLVDHARRRRARLKYEARGKLLHGQRQHQWNFVATQENVDGATADRAGAAENDHSSAKEAAGRSGVQRSYV